MSQPDVIAQALARNDRYLREFVEAFTFCPFAQHTRESGHLARRVLPISDSSDAAVLATVRELHSAAQAEIEIALLIFPTLGLSRTEFDRLAAELRTQTAALGLNGFFIVAFHPDAPVDASTPDRLVSLLRRTPDPTLQLVRVATLDRVRGSQGDTVWIDPTKVDLRSPPPAPPPSLSERIAQANFETAQRVGVEALLAVLQSIRGGH